MDFEVHCGDFGFHDKHQWRTIREFFSSDDALAFIENNRERYSIMRLQQRDHILHEEVN